MEVQEFGYRFNEINKKLLHDGFEHVLLIC